MNVNAGTLIISGTNAQGSGNIVVGNQTGSNALMRILSGANINGTGGFYIGNSANSSAALGLEQTYRRLTNVPGGGGGTGRPPRYRPTYNAIGGRAAGGFVPRTPGGTILRVGEGRYDEVIAQVLPKGRGQGSRGGVTIVQHLHFGTVVGGKAGLRELSQIVQKDAMHGVRRAMVGQNG